MNDNEFWMTKDECWTMNRGQRMIDGLVMDPLFINIRHSMFITSHSFFSSSIIVSPSKKIQHLSHGGSLMGGRYGFSEYFSYGGISDGESFGTSRNFGVFLRRGSLRGELCDLEKFWGLRCG
jgi:hypothetical protein